MTDIYFDYFKNVPVADEYNFVREHDEVMKEIDAKLEILAYGFLGVIGRKIKKN